MDTVMNQIVEDKTTLRRLGLAVLGMCVGALCLIALALVVGHLA
jgi:hypothetical protein